MIKRKKGRSLKRSYYGEEDVNPMEGTSNLADAMLVLAVGIMLALIMNWNVDLNMTTDMNEIDSSNMSEEQVDAVQEQNSLQEKGVVYFDPDTGKYYIKVED